MGYGQSAESMEQGAEMGETKTEGRGKNASLGRGRREAKVKGHGEKTVGIGRWAILSHLSEGTTSHCLSR